MSRKKPNPGAIKADINFGWLMDVLKDTITTGISSGAVVVQYADDRKQVITKEAVTEVRFLYSSRPVFVQYTRAGNPPIPEIGVPYLLNRKYLKIGPYPINGKQSPPDDISERTRTIPLEKIKFVKALELIIVE